MKWKNEEEMKYVSYLQKMTPKNCLRMACSRLFLDIEILCGAEKGLTAGSQTRCVRASEGRFVYRGSL